MTGPNWRLFDAQGAERQGEIGEACDLLKAYLQSNPHLSITRAISQLMCSQPVDGYTYRELYAVEDCDLSEALRHALSEDL